MIVGCNCSFCVEDTDEVENEVEEVEEDVVVGVVERMREERRGGGGGGGGRVGGVRGREEGMSSKS